MIISHNINKKMSRIKEIRDIANVELQNLRDKKLIGKSEEAAIEVHLEGSLEEMSDLLDSDLIKTVCKVAEVLFSKEYLENFGKVEKEFHCSIKARSIRDDPEYIKCPRCFNYISTVCSEPNYDNLCNRCCRVLVNNYPDHPSVPDIRRVLREQNAKRKQERIYVSK